MSKAGSSYGCAGAAPPRRRPARSPGRRSRAGARARAPRVRHDRPPARAPQRAERAGSLGVPGAALVVADPPRARGEERVARRRRALAGDEDTSLSRSTPLISPAPVRARVSASRHATRRRGPRARRSRPATPALPRRAGPPARAGTRPVSGPICNGSSSTRGASRRAHLGIAGRGPHVPLASISVRSSGASASPASIAVAAPWYSCAARYALARKRYSRTSSGAVATRSW